ncbi:hypothetical protein POM88_043447 [Heracleum sosnowskyi]|uniref:DUF4216 domain-containing protein n=1 Tax=Heracleum sosnowskyi TaxID=360622 RepID=A0AAD8H2F7_9APIA|nr:hypothetical protein POM88_043447 [Heracleum sosnowskyi]
MLFGWKTAGHLACPHCSYDHDAYNLSHGRNTTWIFINQLREHNPHITSVEVDRCLESDFAIWFKHYAQDPSLVPNEYIRDIPFGPLRSVKSVPIYYVNGYKFHTREYGADRSTFNSGVCIKGSNFSETFSDYFGIVEEILIVEYHRFPAKKTVLFKCEWFDPTINVGTRIHPRYNIVEVNKRKRLRVYKLFVLAMSPENNQARMRRVMNRTENVPACPGHGVSAPGQGVTALGQSALAPSRQHVQVQSGQHIPTGSGQHIPAQSKQHVRAHSEQAQSRQLQHTPEAQSRQHTIGAQSEPIENTPTPSHPSTLNVSSTAANGYVRWDIGLEQGDGRVILEVIKGT